MTTDNTPDKTGGNTKLQRLSLEKPGRLLLEYSLPAIVGMVVNSLYNIIDRIFIGQGVGPDAIAGLAITFPVMNIATAIGVLVGAGASARVSILLGESNKERAFKVLGNSLLLTIVNATVYILLLGFFLTPLLKTFGASERTLPYAYDFMIWILPGLFLTNLAFNFNNIMRASGYPSKAMFTMIIGAVINIALAPVFIFWLGWGIKGAAIATDIAMTCSAWFVMRHFFDSASVLHFKKGIYKIDWRIIRSIVSIGAAPALVNLASCFINIIINRSLLSHGGDTAIATAGIFVTYTSFITMVVVGLCQGMQPIVGFNYGAGNIRRAISTYRLTVGVATIITGIGCFMGLQFPDLIARAFTSDPYLIDMCRDAFRHALVAFWIVGFQIVSTNLFQSLGKAGISIFLSLSRQVLFMIPILLWLPNKAGLTGVWLSFPISDAFATVVTLILVIYELRLLNRRNNPAKSIIMGKFY